MTAPEFEEVEPAADRVPAAEEYEAPTIEPLGTAQEAQADFPGFSGLG